MRTLFFVLLLVYSANAQDTNNYYISTNIFAPISGINKSSAALNALVPIISNLEYGWNINGIIQHKQHLFETRLTYGRSNSYNRIPQIQMSYLFLIRDYFKHNGSSFYCGANIRYWDYINSATKSQRHSFTTGFSVGFFKRYNHFLIDLRLQQSILIFTQTNIEHSKAALNFNFSPMPKLSPILPFFSLNLGYAF